ncbi:type IV secretion system protein (plasmid) [Cereibacter azotoformans]|uniref:type IV secretion system protein n=1 Tax=Cereibacter azotoformans TaxID=43057 RepID=UPI000E35F750|nr:type IV secretion system protein [Cereibacter azotoformans]AXQ96345.1 type IV secretion system family protein [Cereibacter sphaeroides]UIJ33265.1 type IV secretion system protein [Cereibacter azotoformans]
MTHRLGIVAALSILLGASAASGQGVPVIDATSISNAKTQFTQQLAQMIKEFEEAQRLYSAINGATGMGDVVAMLNDPDVREVLGPDAQRIAASFDINLDDLGDLADTAKAVHAFASLEDENITAEGFYRSELDRIKKQAGRNTATGERIVNLSDDRLGGLERLRQQIGMVETQKEVDALNARIAIEQAMLQNDTNRIQGLSMLQAAQAQAEEQRQVELAAQRRQKEAAGFSATFGGTSF